MTIYNNKIESFKSNSPFLYSGITDDSIANTFDLENVNIGDIVCITPLYDDLIERFGSYENAKVIYNFARGLLERGQYSKFGTSVSVPYLNFTVYLEQNTIDEGVLSPYIENWVAGKKYYVGDTVYYSVDGTSKNLKTYTLVSGSATEYLLIPKSIYDANSGNTDYFISGDEYYVRLTYYCGYYDSGMTMLTYFDEVGQNGKFLHWAENVSIYDGDNDYEGVSGLTESLLHNILRKKSDMDVSGNTLPFILHYNIETINSGQTYTYTMRVLDSETTETFYMCGYTNIKYNSEYGKIVCDELESVTFYNSNDEENSVISFSVDDSLNKPILITTSSGEPFVYVDTTSTIGGGSIKDCNMVKFVYYIGATIDYIGATIDGQNNTWIRKTNTGVRYEERRTFTSNFGTYTLETSNDVEQFTLPYIEIGNNANEYEDVDSSTSNYSNISITNKQINGDYFLNVKTFKDDATIGLHDINEDIDSKIERGIAESYQKHNMLGEICTLQDLENYKNGKYLK